jgi:hypothetical protein
MEEAGMKNHSESSTTQQMTLTGTGVARETPYPARFKKAPKALSPHEQKDNAIRATVPAHITIGHRRRSS